MKTCHRKQRPIQQRSRHGRVERCLRFRKTAGSAHRSSKDGRQHSMNPGREIIELLPSAFLSLRHSKDIGVSSSRDHSPVFPLSSASLISNKTRSSFQNRGCTLCLYLMNKFMFLTLILAWFAAMIRTNTSFTPILICMKHCRKITETSPVQVRRR